MTQIDTRGMSREEWIETRRSSVGGSDAAAIVGMNPYATPFSLWLEKTGRVVPEDISMKEPVRLGNDLEDYVARRFMEETGKKVARKNAILYNPDYPWAHANVDRLVIGEDAGLECKTTSALNLRKYRGGEYPEQYYVQCMHYMAVTGRARWYLAVLVLGREFLVFDIPRDEDEIAALMAAEKSFWEHVERDIEPPMSGNAPDSDALGALYPESDGGDIELFGRAGAIERYLFLGDQIEELEKERDAIKQTIQRDMGAAESAMADAYKVTWKSANRTTYDTKGFIANHPGLLDGYKKTTSYRTFRVEKG